jgi:hypothetical protein
MHESLSLTGNAYFIHFVRAEKIKMCKRLIRPVATYRAESWTLNKDITKWMAVFERKVLRRIFGGVKVNEIWGR